MSKPLKALILEDSPNDLILLLRELRRGSFDLDYLVVNTAADMRDALQNHNWDIILSDFSMGGFDALEALNIVHQHNFDIPTIIVSGTVGEDTAVTAMRAGANDFFAKDKLTRLVPAVERELRDAAERRKRSEAEARFTTAFNASPMGTVISRLSDGKILDVNARILADYNLSRDDVIGKTGAELDIWVLESQRAQIAEQLAAVGSTSNFEVEYHDKHGRRGYALMSAEIIDLDNEKCVLTMINDITDRKESETAMRASEEKFRLLAQNSTDMISRHTPDGRYIYVSPACQTLLGYKPEELITHSIFEFVHPEDTVNLPQSYQAILESGGTYTAAYRIRRKDQHHIWFETTIRPIRDPDTNEVIEIQGASRDISARKESEVALERYAQRLELLHQIDLAILSARNPQDVGELVLTRLQAFVQFDSAIIANYFPDTKQFTIIASSSPVPDYQYNEDLIPSIETFSEKTVLYIEDLSKGTHSPAEMHLLDAGILSCVHIPLMSSGNIFGIFTLYSKKVKAFSPKELDTAKEVASQFAIVIENARLLKVEERRNNELSALHQASLQFTSSLEVQEILYTVIDYAMLLIHAQDAHIFLYDNNKLSFGAALWDGKRSEIPMAEPRQDGLTYTVARSGNRIIIPDVNQHPMYADWQWGGAIIGLPLRVAGAVNGVMSLALQEPHHFDEHEIRLLELLADQAAIAIHNAQLYQQVRVQNDVLEQRVQERTRQLQHANERVYAILNSSSDSIILADSAGRIQQTNPGFNRQFGYDPDSLFNQPLGTLVAEESLGQFQQALETTHNTGNTGRVEILAQRNDNTRFPADTLISTFKETHELMLVLSLRDISNLKRVEAELRGALEKEKELNDLKTKFTSIVSHEFRTPLSVILASSDTLLHYFDRMDQPRRIEKLQNINRQVQRLIRLMNNVLTITQAESVGFEFKPANIDLVELCREILEDLKSGYRQDVSINFVYDEDCRNLIVDEFLIQHILQNLTSNALKYSTSGGFVDISLRRVNDQIILSVKDQGIGIPKAHQKFLFEAFRRAPNVGQIQGTGIGLNIVKRAVDAHGGTIEFISVEGQGTTFIVRLPANKLG